MNSQYKYMELRDCEFCQRETRHIITRLATIKTEHAAYVVMQNQVKCISCDACYVEKRMETAK